jgi:DNA-binding transcriptional regulator YiaG
MRECSTSIVTGRQLRAARVLAGLTQRGLGAALGVNERQIRFWEQRAFSMPSRESLHPRIEQVIRDHGVILFADPTPGARLAK